MTIFLRHSNLSFFVFCFRFSFLLLVTASKMKAFVFQRNLLFLVCLRWNLLFSHWKLLFLVLQYILYDCLCPKILEWSYYTRDRNLSLQNPDKSSIVRFIKQIGTYPCFESFNWPLNPNRIGYWDFHISSISGIQYQLKVAL